MHQADPHEHDEEEEVVTKTVGAGRVVVQRDERERRRYEEEGCPPPPALPGQYGDDAAAGDRSQSGEDDEPLVHVRTVGHEHAKVGDEQPAQSEKGGGNEAGHPGGSELGHRDDLSRPPPCPACHVSPRFSRHVPRANIRYEGTTSEKPYLGGKTGISDDSVVTRTG